MDLNKSNIERVFLANGKMYKLYNKCLYEIDGDEVISTNFYNSKGEHQYFKSCNIKGIIYKEV